MKMYSVTQAAQMTGKSPKTVRALALRYARTGKPIGQRVGTYWAFSAADVRKLAAVASTGGRPTGQRIVRHRWGPVEPDGTRRCKNCGAQQVQDGAGRWSPAPSCQ
jgi:hypothetical protein